MKIKVCGMKEAVNIDELSQLKPDYMGFVFYAKSPRFAAELDNELLAVLPERVIKTAVSVNEDISRVEELVQQYGFQAVQLHGDESAEYCNRFKGRIQVLKAFGINSSFNFELLEPYKNAVDYFLFDTKAEGYGGSGKTFDWEILNNYHLNIPFFLSGGLSLDHIESIKQIKHPQFYGVDLNSRFEVVPGIKDINKLTAAFNLLREPITDEIRS